MPLFPTLSRLLTPSRRPRILARLGRRTEALAQLERVLKTGKRFAERDAAEKMLNELQRASAA